MAAKNDTRNVIAAGEVMTAKEVKFFVFLI